jgi:2-keto-4-pentenoate hydratase
MRNANGGSVAWLCNRLADFDLALEPGQIVMPGSLTAPIDLRPGRTYTARLERLGEVSLRVE